MTDYAHHEQPDFTPDQQPPVDDPYAESAYADNRAHFLDSDFDAKTQQQMDTPLPLPSRSHRVVHHGGRSKAYEDRWAGLPSGDWTGDELTERTAPDRVEQEKGPGYRAYKAAIALVQLDVISDKADGDIRRQLALTRADAERRQRS